MTRLRRSLFFPRPSYRGMKPFRWEYRELYSCSLGARGPGVACNEKKKRRLWRKSRLRRVCSYRRMQLAREAVFTDTRLHRRRICEPTSLQPSLSFPLSYICCRHTFRIHRLRGFHLLRTLTAAIFPSRALLQPFRGFKPPGFSRSLKFNERGSALLI